MKKKPRIGLAALAATMAAAVYMFAAVAPASAAVEAKWSPQNAGIKWYGSLAVHDSSGHETTCSQPAAIFGGLVSGSYFEAPTSGEGYRLNCANGKHMTWAPEGNAWFGTSYSLTFVDRLSNLGFHEGPFGEWGGELTEGVPFTNGSGSTASKLTFSNTRIGVESGGGSVYATGTLEVKTNSGGLLTLTH